MLFAGHHTMSFSLVGFCLDLARQAAKAEIVWEEAKHFETQRPEASWLLASEVLAFLKESLRLRPAAPILYREAARDLMLGGFAVERGRQIWVAPQLIHRDGRYFDGPDRFDPARFKTEGATTPGLFMPFGAGARTCIAKRLSYLQMALTGSMLAARFRFDPGRTPADSVRVIAH